MVAETLLGIALVLGVLGVILVADFLTSRKSVRTPGVEKLTLLRCQGDAGGLEYALRDAVSRGERVYILDAGLSEEGAKRARLLALRYGASFTNGKDFTKELESGHGRDGACGH